MPENALNAPPPLTPRQIAHRILSSPSSLIPLRWYLILRRAAGLGTGAYSAVDLAGEVLEQEIE